MTDRGRTNLVIPTGTSWTRTITYLQAPTVLTGITATAPQGEVTVTVANASGGSVTFTAGDFLSFLGDPGVYTVATGATIANGASGSIVLEGEGFPLALAAALISRLSPVNLSTYTARMQIRATPSAASTILSLTSSPAAGLTINGTAGEIVAALTAAQLDEATLDLSSITAPYGWLEEELPNGEVLRGYGPLAYYDLETVASGVVTRVLQGQVCFDLGTTR